MRDLPAMKRRTPNPGMVGTRGDENLEAGIGLDVYACSAGDGNDTICDTGDRGVLRYGFDGARRAIAGAAIELSDAERQSADGRFRFAGNGTDPLVGITGDARSTDWGGRSGEDTIGALAERRAGVGLSLARLWRKLGAALTLVLAVFAMQSEAAKKETHANPRFSPDGKSLVFDRCDPDECRIHVYNLQTGTLGYYRPPPGDSWRQGCYSNAGDKLVFVTQPVGVYAQRHEILPRSQIAIMNLDGSNMRVVTHTVGYKGMPAFSHSGKKVIFAQAGRIRDEGATIASRWDLWEVDLESGAANLFAGRFEFYQMGLSVYFPDDERVLLNAYGPSNQALVASGLAKDHADFDRLFKRNGVFVLKRGQAVLAPPLFPDFGSTHGAILDAQGNMFFRADGGPGEGIRIRRVGLDGSRQSWRHPPVPEGTGRSVLGVHVSRDGRYFVVSESVGSPWGGMRRHGSKLMLLDTVTGVWREVVLPREAKQINR